MARTGGQPEWSTPRLPTAPKQLDPHDIGDPAHGEKVPRCLTCGTPRELMVGTFIPDRDQHFAGRRFRYRLCASCIQHANGPLDPDPLDAIGDS